MWAYILRKLLYNIPVYLGIILVMMLALRVSDPVAAYLGKNATQQEINVKRTEMGLDRPFIVQYATFVGQIVTFDFSEQGWNNKTSVGKQLASSIPPSLAITVPSLVTSALISMTVALIAAFYRGRFPDKFLMFISVLGMSISFLVYVILGQYWGAFLPQQRLNTDVFAVAVSAGADVSDPWFFLRPNKWVYYCMLPVIINVIVTMGYDTRYYRAVMVEETNRDYIVTARAKGATRRKIMFVHMLKNAMIPIITHLMITLPFLIAGSVVLEMYFLIPGMGRTLINAIVNKDFPVIQGFTAVLAAIFIVSNILTDVLYALVDPRVRLS
ncbi:MAG: ABC transporter permease [Phycisphaeraceae bacterium]|nr:ABC transporter permease [Phycisphaeraceae bacterium]